jgi:hypothetical protein
MNDYKNIHPPGPSRRSTLLVDMLFGLALALICSGLYLAGLYTGYKVGSVTNAPAPAPTPTVCPPSEQSPSTKSSGKR